MVSNLTISFPESRLPGAHEIINTINPELLSNIEKPVNHLCQFSISSRHKDAHLVIIALQKLCRTYEHADANAIATQENIAIEKQVLFKEEAISYYFAIEFPHSCFKEFFKNFEAEMQRLVADNQLPSATLAKFSQTSNILMVFGSSYEQDPVSLEKCLKFISVPTPKFYFNSLIFRDRTLFLTSLETKRNRDFLRAIYFDMISSFPKNSTRFEGDIPKISLIHNIVAEPKTLMEEFNQIHPILIGPVSSNLKIHIMKKEEKTYKTIHSAIL